jgi:hypothetical protein
MSKESTQMTLHLQTHTVMQKRGGYIAFLGESDAIELQTWM